MLKTELALFLSCLTLAYLDQFLKDRFIQLPWPMPIGIGQGRARRRSPHTQMFQLPFTGCQAANDLAQRAGAAKMAKHQRDELAPARHAFGVLLRLMFVHRRIENGSREKFENLLENTGYLFHRWVSPSVGLLVTAQPYQERPPGSPTLSRYTRAE
jgi:hypothetical protein